jgi:hypothetical protein
MNRIDLEQAIRKTASVRPEVRAVPSLREIVSEYIAAEAMRNERDRAAGARLELGKSALTERGRQFEARLDESGRQFEARTAEADREFADRLALDRAYLGSWSNANQWATAVSIGNLGVTGLGMKANLQEVAKQERLQREIVDLLKDNARLYPEGMKSLRLGTEDALSRIINRRSTRYPADVYPGAGIREEVT